MPVSTFLRGELIQLATVVMNENGLPADPATLTLRVRKPDGTTETFSSPSGISRSALGNFFKNFQVTLAGRHYCRWESTGPVGSSEDEFVVKPGEFTT